MDQDNTLWIRPYLEAGEQILWLGKPEKLHLLSAQDVFLIPFSLLWFGFVVFYNSVKNLCRKSRKTGSQASSWWICSGRTT